MKRTDNPVWVMVATVVVLGLFWLGLDAAASDINKGYTFLPTDHVTSTKLNNLVDAATIAPSFVSGQTATLVPAPGDSFLLYSASATALRKASLAAVGASILTNSDAGMRSNFWADLWTSVPGPTNLPAFDATSQLGAVPVWSPTNGNWQQVSWPQVYTSPPFNFTYAFRTNLAHGLTNTPQQVRWVLTCVSQQDGFYPGDELDVSQVQGYLGASGTTPAFSAGANSSNVWIHCATNAGFSLPNAYITVGTNVTGNSIRLTNSDWQLKCYARYWP